MTEPPNAISGGGSNHQALPGFHLPKQKGGQLKKSQDDPLYSQKSPYFFWTPLKNRGQTGLEKEISASLSFIYLHHTKRDA